MSSSDDDYFVHPTGMRAKLREAERRTALDERGGDERKRELADQDEFFRDICTWGDNAKTAPEVVL